MVRVKVFSNVSWGQCPWLLLAFLSILCITISPSSQSPCSDLVPEPTPVDTKRLRSSSFRIQSGYFRPQGKFLGLDPRPKASYSATQNPVVDFNPHYLSETSTEGLLHLQGTLVFRTGGFYAVPFNASMMFSRRSRHFYRFSYPLWSAVMEGVWIFELDGFWSEADGRVCMSGSGKSFARGGNVTLLSCVLRLNFRKNSTILTSLVTGALESLGDNHFDPISIMGYNYNEHNYTLIPKAKKICASVGAGEESLGLSSNRRICSILNSVNNGFELEYENGCASRNCNPLGKGSGFLPKFMAFGALTCSDNGNIQMYMTFFNSSYYGHPVPFVPNSTFVGEGFWDEKKNHLCFLVCRITNSTRSLADSFVTDCMIGTCLRFPASLSIRNRSRIVGHIWSTRSLKESGYFDRIAFRNLENRVADVSGFKYKYTKIDWVKRLCILKKTGGNTERKYPSGASYRDLRFGIYRSGAAGYIYDSLTPLFIGDRYYGDHRAVLAESSTTSASEATQQLWNVSYTLDFRGLAHKRTVNASFMNFVELNEEKAISAEGIYDASTGTLCMAGCRYLGQNFQNLSKEFDRMDCEIFINVQYPPLDRKAGERLSGTMKSTRNKSDPLYFEPLEFYSAIPYQGQVSKMIKRMDLEIIMVLITLTLACLCIASQLLHIKRHPDILPSVSLLMVIILTLGHMIPLVLNFEAMFFWGKTKQNVLLRSGGWLEANEVIVRVITMVAFLLQFRLLQLVVSARLAEMGEKGLLAVESKVLKWCLPLYFLGGLVALVVHYMKPLGSRAHHSLWEYLLSYGGLVLDAFLVPQAILNFCSNSKGKALAITFYVGTTLVRALPHAYDAYRANIYLPQFEGSYMYADPRKDFYSAAWDFIIPVGGLLLAIIICLQQQFGGGCILPSKFRKVVEYELVPRSDG